VFFRVFFSRTGIHFSRKRFRVGTTSMSPLEDLLARQKAAFLLDMNPGLDKRRALLDRIEAMMLRHEGEISTTISDDFGNRSIHETLVLEFQPLLGALRHARKNLKNWMAPRRPPTAASFLPGHNRLLRQPLGVVGVISPWNYPLDLALAPAVAAIASGNRVMIKPSELTPRFAQLLARMVGESFAPEEIAVVTGDSEVGRAFSELPFDHLLFTGSTPVGRLVAQAAAKNLTPVTLELGGKSPAILHEDYDVERAARSLAFGKWFNAGQTCIAPDYMLAPRHAINALVGALKGVARRNYPGVANNPDYTSIVSPRHYQRLQALLSQAVEAGAQAIVLTGEGENFPPGLRKIPPTLVLGAKPDMAIMQEEIFGPLLPILPYDTLDEALAFVNARDRPLALYAFGDDEGFRQKILNGTIAGGVTLNDCLLHFAQEEQPFGGVGPSGMGAYHGEWGFRAFSKEKPVFVQSRFNALPLLFPPFGKTFERMTGLMRRLL
jgi:coniferyl-aldehyde dehydrogenase